MKKPKKLFYTIVMMVFIFTSSCNQKKDSEWIPIFNGKDLTGWSPKFTGEAYRINYLNTFQAKDGKLIVSYDDYDNFDNEFVQCCVIKLSFITI